MEDHDKKGFLDVFFKNLDKAEPWLICLTVLLTVLKISANTFTFINQILLLLLGTLILIYMYYAEYILLIEKYHSRIHISLRITFRIAYYSISIMLCGILFHIMFWDGYYYMLIAGIAIGAISLVLLYYRKDKFPESYIPHTNRSLARLFITVVVTILMLDITDKELYRMVHKDSPEQIRLFERKVDNPENKQYEKEFWDYQRNR